MAKSSRYHAPALASALDLVARATSPGTAGIVKGIILARRGRDPFVDMRAVALAADEPDLVSLRERIEAANFEVRASFSATLTGVRPQAVDQDSSLDNVVASLPADERLWLSTAFVDLLDQPSPMVEAGDAMEPDAAAVAWVEIAAACPKSDRGHHLALRCLRRGERETADFAGLVALRARHVVHVTDDHVGVAVEWAVLRAELHAGAEPTLVVMDRQLASDVHRDDDDDDKWDMPVVQDAPKETRSHPDERRMHIVQATRNSYVWRASASLVIDETLAAFFGAAIGPLAPSRRWRDAVVDSVVPGLSAVGRQAVVGRVADPRDAVALGSLISVAASALNIDADEAAVLVAGSHSAASRETATAPAAFDARLVVCDEAIEVLFARASELARHGTRLLFWGPPGGGKSTAAVALAAAMGQAPERRTKDTGHPGGASTRGVFILGPAQCLARQLGVTERVLGDAFSRAAEDGTILILDELDSLCGVREPGASGNNATLVRWLTNEFLRNFDAHPLVPIIATCNDLQAVDPAIIRRFPFVVAVSGELSPEAERLAWRSILDVEPPTDWTPVGGANVSDFANAKSRCRMLGTMDPASLADAVERARDARLGPRPAPASRRRSLQ